jgi:DNA-directed RNA polymerase specialized sigma24 family protein
VRQLIRRPEFRKQDREDLRQDLLVGLLEGLPRFDPGQGHRNPFVTTVIERTAASLVQRARAKKRDCRSLCSFNARNEAAAGAPGELAETVGQREHDARRGRHPRTDHELSQLRIDVAEVLGFLPEHLRARALQLMRSSKTQTARNLGISRSTLQESIRVIRAVFDDAGRCANISNSKKVTGHFELEPSRWTGKDLVFRSAEGGTSMELYHYIFRPNVPMADVEGSLLLAVVATESLHGEAQTRLDSSHHIDWARATCVVDAGTPVGRDLNRLFVGFLRHEFGRDAFRVARVGAKPTLAREGAAA